MYRLASRLVLALRRSSQLCNHHSTFPNSYIPSLPILSASLTVGTIFLSTSDQSPQFEDLRHLPRPQSSALVLTVRDLPAKASELAEDIYSGIKKGILRRVNSEGSGAVTLLTALNVGIYLLWKGAPTSFMVRHFANSLESVRRGRVWTSVTSNFSHMSLFHLGANMYLLNRFGPEVVEILGSERFYIFYGTAGIASSLTSLTFRRLTRSNVLSLGASGAVVSVLWLYACFFPDRRMGLIGTDKTISMQELVLAYSVIDAAGLLGSLGKIDFAAHLGGALFGNSWFYTVRDKLVQEEEARQRKRANSIFGNRLPSEERARKRD